MNCRLLEEKIKEYPITNAIDQENILQEIVQLFVLGGLARAGLFSKGDAVFHGGTCLRLIYGMNRFSEDLDFFLKKPDPGFSWQKYVERVLRDGPGEGFSFQAEDKSKVKTAVKKSLLRTALFSPDADLGLPYPRDPRKLIKVKLEIDVNPPAGSKYDTRYIAFPMMAAITTQTLGSGFAMKLGAILCRTYTKGRDWYDFIWYINKRVVPDLQLLRNALRQQGPWAGEKVPLDPGWLDEHLKKRIIGIEWRAVRQDVQRFLPLREQETLELWDRNFFLHHLSRLIGTLNA